MEGNSSNVVVVFVGKYIEEMDNANIIIVGVGCVCVFALSIVQNFTASGNVPISDAFFHSQYSSDTISKCSKTLLGSDFHFMHHSGNTVAIENYDFITDSFGSQFTYLVCNARACIQGFAHRGGCLPLG